jgi:acyl-CoA synthetase (AMP-forming)/AMP-acid ligase II
MPGLRVHVAFGGYSTFTGVLTAVNAPDVDDHGEHQRGSLAGTVGHPLPGVVAKVVDPETGEGPLIGRDGLLLVNGPNRMQGYLGDLPSGLAARGETTLQVLAERYRVRVTDWQVFGTTENAAVESPPPELRLQGNREIRDAGRDANRRITVSPSVARGRPRSSCSPSTSVRLCKRGRLGRLFHLPGGRVRGARGALRRTIEPA